MLGGGAPPGAAPPKRAALPRAGLWVLRIAVTTLALAWVLSRIDLVEVGTAVVRIPPAHLALAALLLLANVAGIGTLRWRALLDAYGAGFAPPLATLARLNLIGLFYNTWLPGGLGGDVVRGMASRAAFAGREGDGEAERAAGGVAVVLVERTLGLIGLLVLSGLAALATRRDVPGLALWSVIGIGAGLAAIAALAAARQLGARLPGRIGSIARSLPAIVRPSRFVLACALSIGIHVIVSAIGHLMIASIDPRVSLAQSMTIVPLAMATQFLPITVGGAGARELAFVVLYGAVGVAESDALAASVGVLLVQLGVSALGAFTPATVTRVAPHA